MSRFGTVMAAAWLSGTVTGKEARQNEQVKR